MTAAALATNTSRTAGIIAGYRDQIASLESRLSGLRYDNECLRQERLLIQRQLDDERAKSAELSKKLALASPSTLTANSVLNEISSLYDIPVHVIRSPRRSAILVTVRHHAMYEVARRCKWMSYPEIARMFDRDHTTAIWAIREWPAKAAKLGISVKPLGRERTGE